MTFLQKIGCIDWNNKPSTSQNSTLLRQITFAKSRPTPPLKMEKKLVNEQEEPLNPKPKKNLTLKVSQIPIMHLSFGCARFNSDFSVDEERKKWMKKVQINDKNWPFIMPDTSNVLRSHMAKSYVDDFFLTFLRFHPGIQIRVWR